MFSIIVLQIYWSALIASIVFYWYYRWKHRRFYYLASKFNGPKPLPIIGNMLIIVGQSKDVIRKLTTRTKSYYLSQRTPMALWFGPKLFLFPNTPQQLQIILNSPYALEKNFFYKYSEPWVEHGLLTAPVNKWKVKRKVITKAFNPKILDSFADILQKHAYNLVRRLEKNVNKGPFNINHYTGVCTLQALCETSLGIETTDDDDYTNYWTVVEQMFHLLHDKALWYQFDIISKYTRIGREMNRCINYLHSFADDIINKNREKYPYKNIKQTDQDWVVESDTITPKPFIQLLMEHSNFDNQEIREEVNLMVIVGSESTKTTLNFTFLMIAMYPKVQERIIEEIDSVFGDSERQIELSDLSKFNYLEMVIKETMRLFPIVPGFARESTGEIDLGDGIIIPKGVSIAVPLLSIHRDPEQWPNPNKFIPERFLPDEVAKRHPYSYMPFSIGPRNCIGVRYAYMNMKYILVTVLRTYVLSTHLTRKDLKLQGILTVGIQCGFDIEIRYRNQI